MTRDDLEHLHDRLMAMTPDERAELDHIADAVEAYMAKRSTGARIAANRTAALACVDVVRAWSAIEMQNT